jgi:hypothetical protein
MTLPKLPFSMASLKFLNGVQHGRVLQLLRHPGNIRLGPGTDRRFEDREHHKYGKVIEVVQNHRGFFLEFGRRTVSEAIVAAQNLLQIRIVPLPRQALHVAGERPYGEVHSQASSSVRIISANPEGLLVDRLS